jgi:translation initiation factor RLI1
MKYEYVIILLLVLIICLTQFFQCNVRHIETTSKQTYDSIHGELDKFKLTVDSLKMQDSLLIVQLGENDKKKSAITKKYVPKYDTLRHASTVMLDSTVRSILQRHGLLHD